MTVAVLFARADSHYKTLPDVEVFDMERDARTYDGPWPVVAHPPCRAWGQLSHLAKPRHDEKDLGRWAVKQVRTYGGVLEHPKKSKLWADQGLPAPGHRDEFGGFTLPIHQNWWGHKAEKPTLLYVCGIEPHEVPDIPMTLGDATHVIAQNRSPLPSRPYRLRKGMPGWRPTTTKAEAEHTPPDLARWLVDLAERCAIKDPA